MWIRIKYTGQMAGPAPSLCTVILIAYDNLILSSRKYNYSLLNLFVIIMRWLLRAKVYVMYIIYITEKDLYPHYPNTDLPQEQLRHSCCWCTVQGSRYK